MATTLDACDRILAAAKKSGRVLLVGDPAKGGGMDFAGMMEGYTQFFGTKDQPKLPARSAVQVAGLAAPGMLVEIEIVFARP